MVDIINKILVIDFLILVVGLLILFLRPFGWDMTYGIIIIATSLIISMILFLLKLTIVEKKKIAT